MKKVIFLYLSVFVCSTVLIGQTSLHGTLKNQETGESILIGEIKLFKNQVFVKSIEPNFHGDYFFASIDPGTYDIEFSFVGYQTKRIEKVTVFAGMKNKLAVELPKGEASDEVYVEEFKRPPFQEQPNPTSCKVITSDEIKNLPTRSLNAMAATSAGLASDYEPVQSKVIITETPLSNQSKRWTELTARERTLGAEIWGIHTQKRYAVRVVNVEEVPLPNCKVELLGEDGAVVWEAKTDNNGRAELWAGLFLESAETASSIRVTHGDVIAHSKTMHFYQEGINTIKLPVSCPEGNSADVLFVIDGTGSMKEEIDYLKTELAKVIGRIKYIQPGLQFRTGGIFYRDYDERYLTHLQSLSTRTAPLIKFFNQHQAAGGGDHPEAVEAALKLALQENWNPNSIARIVFLLYDGPPRQVDSTITSLHQIMKESAKLGIKIIPISTSTFDPETIFLMESLALNSNATCVGVQQIELGSHAVHNNGNWQELNDFLVQLISQYTSLEPCDEEKELLIYGKENLPKYSDHLSEQITYYPNPASQYVHLELASEMAQLTIQNAQGQIIQELKDLKPGSTKISVGHWPTGVYFLAFRQKTAYVVKRLVVE